VDKQGGQGGYQTPSQGIVKNRHLTVLCKGLSTAVSVSPIFMLMVMIQKGVNGL